MCTVRSFYNLYTVHVRVFLYYQYSVLISYDLSKLQNTCVVNVIVSPHTVFHWQATIMGPVSGYVFVCVLITNVLVLDTRHRLH